MRQPKNLCWPGRQQLGEEVVLLLLLFSIPFSFRVFHLSILACFWVFELLMVINPTSVCIFYFCYLYTGSLTILSQQLEPVLQLCHITAGSCTFGAWLRMLARLREPCSWSCREKWWQDTHCDVYLCTLSCYMLLICKCMISHASAHFRPASEYTIEWE